MGSRSRGMNTLYKTEVSIKGGSNARLSSPDRNIDLDLRLPTELGGPGGATNAEQLFAAAYAACLSSALSAAALESDNKMPTSPEIDSRVELARDDNGGYRMAVRLSVQIPGMDAKASAALIKRAREIWPWRDANAVTLDIDAV